MLDDEPDFDDDESNDGWGDYIQAMEDRLEEPEIPAQLAVKKDNTMPESAEQIRDVNAALKKAHSLDILARRLQSGLQRAMVQEEQLARDLAVFGDTHRGEILTTHNITEADLAELLATEKFAQRVQAIRTEINHDTKGLIRARAAMYLEAGLDNAYEIANNPHAKDNDRLKAIHFLATIADALPRAATADSGTFGTGNGAVNVVFNFGNNHPHKSELQGITVEGEVDDV